MIFPTCHASTLENVYRILDCGLVSWQTNLTQKRNKNNSIILTNSFLRIWTREHKYVCATYDGCIQLASYIIHDANQLPSWWCFQRLVHCDKRGDWWVELTREMCENTVSRFCSSPVSDLR